MEEKRGKEESETGEDFSIVKISKTLKEFWSWIIENMCIKFSTDLKLRLNPEVWKITTAGDYFNVRFFLSFF